MDNPKKLATYDAQDEEKTKQNTICIGHHYTQVNTNNIHKALAILQTTGGKDNRTSFAVITARNSERMILIFDFWCFNATFSNISAISWRPVLVVKETGVPGENHRPWASNCNLYHLRLRVECTLFCNLQSWARTHAVLVIGLYELLNPTT